MKGREPSNIRERIYEIIFEADTPLGKLFDVSLLLLIIISVLAVMFETVEDWEQQYSHIFYPLEWILTLLFTLEYLMRLWVVKSPWKYATSFYGIIDLLSIVPSYLGFFFVNAHTQYLLTIRALRLMRVFRIFKLGRFLGESEVLIAALKASRAKITVFLIAVLTSVTIIGSIMYLVEGSYNESFSSIPRSMYWAIVTITTVGYGDIAPITNFGQFLAAILMIMGYGIIAVPTGIVSAELVQANTKSDDDVTNFACSNCTEQGHDHDAVFCKYCGEKL